MVQQLRLDAEMTIGQLVLPLRSLGVTEAHIRRVEDNQERASLESVRHYASALGASFSGLFDVWDRESPNTEDRMTVAEARAMIRRLLKAGVECPCCGRTCKERRQSLTPNMVRFVRWLVSTHRGTPVSIRDWQREHAEYGGDYAKTEHWGLTRRELGRAPLWSPTLKGTKFVRAQVKVHKVAVLWRNKVLRWDGDLLDISELLRETTEHDDRGDEPPPSLPGMEPQ